MGWFDFLKRKDIPKSTFVEAYESLFEKKIPSQSPVDQLTFVVFDTETTGLNPKNDYILSFGAVKVKGYKMKLETCKEMYLEAPINRKEAILVHEILYPEQCLTLKNFAQDLLKYIGSDIIVGHHIGFDIAMLEKALRPFGLKKILNPAIDTLGLSLRLEKGPRYDPGMGRPGEYALESLCQKYGIPLDDRHTASGDAFLTAQVLMKLLKTAEQKGIKDFGSLMR